MDRNDIRLTVGDTVGDTVVISSWISSSDMGGDDAVLAVGDALGDTVRLSARSATLSRMVPG